MRFSNLKEAMLRLKSRQHWLAKGDKNTRFFHNAMKERNRRNAITMVAGANKIVEGVGEVKEAVINHFVDFFKESNLNRLVPERLEFKRLNE